MTAWAPRLLALLRIVAGLLFLEHATMKLFAFPAPFPMPGPLPPLLMAAGVIELVAGLLITLGLFTRIAAILLAIDMLGAIVFVHGRNGFFLPMGFEFALTLLGAFVALAVAGPGEYSIDNRRR